MKFIKGVLKVIGTIVLMFILISISITLSSYSLASQCENVAIKWLTDKGYRNVEIVSQDCLIIPIRFFPSMGVVRFTIKALDPKGKEFQSGLFVNLERKCFFEK